MCAQKLKEVRGDEGYLRTHRYRDSHGGGESSSVRAMGLSITEGFHLLRTICGFRTNFGDFRARYGWRRILDGMFHSFATEEEKWGFWSRLAYLASYQKPVSNVMRQLRALTADKPTFVLTSNGEDHFVPAGFAAENVFEMEGTFTHNRCARGCSEGIWSNREEVLRLAAAERDGRVPTELLPRCPHCGGPAEVDMASGQDYFRSRRWQEKAQAFERFVQDAQGKRLSFSNSALAGAIS